MGAQPSTLNRTQEHKFGKYTHYLPPGFKSNLIFCIRHAEQQKGRPVYIVEIKDSWDALCNMPYFTPWTLQFGCYDLFQNDELLADELCEKFTLDPKYQRNENNEDSQFELYSDRYMRKFSHFNIDDQLRFTPNEKAKTINFDNLKNILLSTDLGLITEYEKLVSGNLKFLDSKVNMVGNRVCFASYPRTGNTLLRKILESITGVFTGSDMPLFKTM
jgi:hypothetical protein